MIQLNFKQGQCSNITTSTSYSSVGYINNDDVIRNGTILYTDTTGDTPYNGGNHRYIFKNSNKSVVIDSDGEMKNQNICTLPHFFDAENIITLFKKDTDEIQNGTVLYNNINLTNVFDGNNKTYAITLNEKDVKPVRFKISRSGVISNFTRCDTESTLGFLFKPSSFNNCNDNISFINNNNISAYINTFDDIEELEVIKLYEDVNLENIKETASQLAYYLFVDKQLYLLSNKTETGVFRNITKCNYTIPDDVNMYFIGINGTCDNEPSDYIALFSSVTLANNISLYTNPELTTSFTNGNDIDNFLVVFENNSPIKKHFKLNSNNKVINLSTC